MYNKLQNAFDILSMHKEALIGTGVGVIVGASTIGVCWYISKRKVDSTYSNSYNYFESSAPVDKSCCEYKIKTDMPVNKDDDDDTYTLTEVELSSVVNGYDQLIHNLNVLREEAEAEAAEYQKEHDTLPFDNILDEDDVIPDHPQEDPPEEVFIPDEEAHNPMSKDIYVITEEEFNQLQLSSDIYWDHEELEWYTVDNIVCNASTDEVYDDPCEYISDLYLVDDNWAYDDKSEGDIMHVRNDGLETDYIVYKVEGAYYYESQT